MSTISDITATGFVVNLTASKMHPKHYGWATLLSVEPYDPESGPYWQRDAYVSDDQIASRGGLWALGVTTAQPETTYTVTVRHEWSTLYPGEVIAPYDEVLHVTTQALDGTGGSWDGGGDGEGGDQEAVIGADPGPSRRVDWVLGYDPTYRRAVLFAPLSATESRMFCHDGTGWDEMDTALYGKPSCAATVSGPGGYLVFGGPDMDEIDGGTP